MFGTYTATLLRDITAGELAMDSADGYSAGHIIGRTGTSVRVMSRDGDGTSEVTGFSDDPHAAGFVPDDALDFRE